MKVDIEDQINVINNKFDIIISINKALMSCICGTDELEKSDGGNFAIILEDYLKLQNQLLNELIQDKSSRKLYPNL